MCKLITHFSSKLFQCGGFKFVIKSVINLSFRIFYQTYCHVAKNMFLLNGFMKRSYLDIPDLLQAVAVAVKLQEKSHQRCLLIYHLCYYLHFRRKIRIIIKICKFAKISWISKNWKNFAEYAMLWTVWAAATINIKNICIYLHTRLGNFAKYIFPCPALFPIVLNSFLVLSLDGMYYNFVT